MSTDLQNIADELDDLYRYHRGILQQEPMASDVNNTRRAYNIGKMQGYSIALRKVQRLIEVDKQIALKV